MGEKSLTEDQAFAIIAFFDTFDLYTTGVWAVLEEKMRDEFGILDPEQALEDAKDALR